MPFPAVSVVMPVYNAEAFLSEAIHSMLQQSLPDFELIIINDGSTDASRNIIQGFQDARIRYIENEKNQGVTFTLNRGIELCNARFMARMDADDISVPTRLEKQLEFLKNHRQAAVVASVVELINEEGKPIGFWKEDHNNLKAQDIEAYLPRNNCIAHPSIMARTEVMKEFRYQPAQLGSEDYDLWLRLISAGLQIHKIPEVLLRHRILPSSVTRGRQDNVYFRLATTKGRFLWQQLGERQFTEFNLSVGLQALADIIRGSGKAFKKIFRAG